MTHNLNENESIRPENENTRDVKRMQTNMTEQFIASVYMELAHLISKATDEGKEDVVIAAQNLQDLLDEL